MLKTDAYCPDCGSVQPIVVEARFTVIFTPKDKQLSLDRRVPDEISIHCDICGGANIHLEPQEVLALERATRDAL